MGARMEVHYTFGVGRVKETGCITFPYVMVEWCGDDVGTVEIVCLDQAKRQVRIDSACLWQEETEEAREAFLAELLGSVHVTKFVPRVGEPETRAEGYTTDESKYPVHRVPAKC